MIRPFFILASVFVISSLPLAKQAHAEDLSETGVSQLVAMCAAALDDGDSATASAAAIELADRDGFHLGEDSRFSGMKCLKAHFNDNFFFDPDKGRFVSQESERLRIEARAAAESLQRQRGSEYAQALIRVCNEEYTQDQFRAVTNPACAEVFRTLGLPDKSN